MVAFIFLGLGLVIAAGLVWAWFALTWLKTGFWPGYTSIDAFCWATSCAPDSWALWPQSWLGVHKVLMWLSPPTALLIAGLASISVAIISDP